METKVKAYARLSAQYTTAHLAAKIVEAVCGKAGIHSRVAYAEAFQPYRPEIYKTLPISHHSREFSEGSWEDGLDRLQLIAPYLDEVEG